MDLLEKFKNRESRKVKERHVCSVCGAENSEIFCPHCKTFQIDRDRWDIELSPEEAAGPIPKGYVLTPPEYGEVAAAATQADTPKRVEHTPLRTLHAAARYRYWPASASIIASFFLLLLPLIPVGNRSAIVNADIEIVLYSLFGVLSAFGYLACGAFRLYKAVKDPFERLPLCTILQTLLLVLDVVMFSLIISFGYTPHDPIALWITIAVAAIVGLAVVVYLVLTIINFMRANTFKRRVIAEKFRRELRYMPQTFSKGKKLFIGVTCVMMLVVVLLASVISATVGTSQVNKDAPEILDMGATFEDAQRVLGEPHLIEDNVWYYYSNNYYTVLKKIQSYEKKGRDTAALKEQLADMEYSQLKICFDSNGGYYLGMFNAALKNGMPINEQKMLYSGVYSSHTIKGELEYYAKLVDGSTEYGLLSDYTVEATDEKGPDDSLVYVRLYWSGVLADYTAKIPERLLPEDRRPSMNGRQ